MKISKEVAEGLIRDIGFGEITIGVDIGSRAAKAALITKDAIYVGETGTAVDMQETAEYIIDKLLKEAGLTLKDVAYIVGTGYGRILLDFEGVPTRVITEISCHGMGAHYLSPDAQTIIDIGGQDSKAIKIDPENGKVVEFIMNDKCAAGTGRFLEKVAELLDLTLEESGEISLKASGDLEISSQCVVFAESEIITLKASGATKEDIVAAVNLASARRIRTLINRIGLKSELVFSGGVSKNPGMRTALEKIIGHSFAETKLDMLYNGALGAAIFAQKYRAGVEI
jgi:predicted CoA-substrate-specific enzyme activase